MPSAVLVVVPDRVVLLAAPGWTVATSVEVSISVDVAVIVRVWAWGETRRLAVTKIVAVVTRVSRTVIGGREEGEAEVNASADEDAPPVTVTVTVCGVPAVHCSGPVEGKLRLAENAELAGRLDEGAVVWTVIVVPLVTVVVV